MIGPSPQATKKFVWVLDTLLCLAVPYYILNIFYPYYYIIPGFHIFFSDCWHNFIHAVVRSVL